MANPLTPVPKTSDKPAEKPPETRQDSFRETIESIVIAFVLAFLFRSFEAEAFVIPTGSMAPTLTGLHKDLAGRQSCIQCKHEYFVGASEEVDTETGAQKYESMDRSRPRQIASGTCPVCGYTMDIGPENPQHQHYYSYTGDRILVSKFAYQFQDPERWDVVVFKYPQSAQKNYIKRLIGKPNETVKIYQGDIYTRDDLTKGAEFQIARKPPNKLRAMMQMVYDNDLALAWLPQVGWQPRWSPAVQDPFEVSDAPPAQGAWVTSADGHEFSTPGKASELTWLRYRHFLPGFQDWELLEEARTQGTRIPLAQPVLPKLVNDFTAYNSGDSTYNYDLAADAAKRNLPPPRVTPDSYLSAQNGLHWVGDLVVDCELTVKPGANAGEARLELIRAGESFECRFDLATGIATLVREGTPIAISKGPTAVKGSGTWDLSLANVDRQLTLWVDGDVVEMVRTDNGSVQKQVPYGAPQEAVPTVRDLSPVGIAVSGVEASVSHLKLWRDIYYISASMQSSNMMDYSQTPAPGFLSSPDQWDRMFRVMRESPPFELKADQFMVMGDNSAKSSDSRLWSTGPVVPRDLMIGKALFIFWPHAWETPWNTEVNAGPLGSIRVPFYPNFKRMTLIR